jgi:hypothetical protein
MNKIKETLKQHSPEYDDVQLADGFEDAFIGIGDKFGVLSATYDKQKCLQILQKDMSEEEAIEYFEYNVLGSWVGDNTPIFLEYISILN